MLELNISLLTGINDLNLKIFNLICTSLLNKAKNLTLCGFLLIFLLFHIKYI